MSKPRKRTESKDAAFLDLTGMTVENFEKKLLKDVKTNPEPFNSNDATFEEIEKELSRFGHDMVWIGSDLSSLPKQRTGHCSNSCPYHCTLVRYQASQHYMMQHSGLYVCPSEDDHEPHARR